MIGEYTTEQRVSLPNKTGWFVTKWREKCELRVFFRKTNGDPEGEFGPYIFRPVFSATDENLPDDDINRSGRCGSDLFMAYPGPARLVTPCVPGNMNMPTNGFLSFSLNRVELYGDLSDDADE